MKTEESPREEQIAKGITYFTGLRERQRQIKRATEELK
jgi:hypothetical protein